MYPAEWVGLGLIVFFVAIGAWALYGNSSPYELPRGKQ